MLPNIILSYNELYLPDVRGLYKQYAVKKLKNLGLKVKIEKIPYTLDREIGKVIKMSPPPPNKIKSGRTIEISIPQNKTSFILPDFTNQSLRNTILKVKKLKLNIDTVMYEHFSEYDEDVVTFHNPRAGHYIEEGTSISFMVSKGAPPDIFIIPDLINLSLNKGKIILTEHGLRVGDIEYEYQPTLLNGTIIEQSLTPGMSVSIPASLDLIVTKDNK